MSKLEITNMVMVQDQSTGKVVVQERVKSWCWIAFPGGHAESNESIYDSAVREIKEETGLDMQNLKACGFMYWFKIKKLKLIFAGGKPCGGRLSDDAFKVRVIALQIAKADPFGDLCNRMLRKKLQ